MQKEMTKVGVGQSEAGAACVGRYEQNELTSTAKAAVQSTLYRSAEKLCRPKLL